MTVGDVDVERIRPTTAASDADGDDLLFTMSLGLLGGMTSKGGIVAFNPVDRSYSYLPLGSMWGASHPEDLSGQRADDISLEQLDSRPVVRRFGEVADHVFTTEVS